LEKNEINIPKSFHVTILSVTKSGMQQKGPVTKDQIKYKIM